MNYIIVFEDTNNAIKGELCLIDAGVPVSVMPLPESIGKGCGITLRVSGDKLDDALEALESKGVSVLAVYSREKGAKINI
jgi:hypothetical protein